MRLISSLIGVAILSLGAGGCQTYSSDPAGNNPTDSPSTTSLEHKLDLILEKLDHVEKRLDKIELRKQAGKEEKLDQILDRVNGIESRLGEIEKKRGANQVEQRSLAASLEKPGFFQTFSFEKLFGRLLVGSTSEQTPQPVSPGQASLPWVTERMEEKYITKNDFRTQILPPIRQGFPPPECATEPNDGEVMKSLGTIRRGVPYFYEEARDNIQIVKERVVDRIDAPRFFPLVGPAQLHHCHWKCTVYYSETIKSGYPFPLRVARPRVEVVYIDKDHLHLYPASGAVQPAKGEPGQHP